MGEAKQRRLAKLAGKPWDVDKPRQANRAAIERGAVSNGHLAQKASVRLDKGERRARLDAWVENQKQFRG